LHFINKFKSNLIIWIIEKAKKKNEYKYKEVIVNVF